MDKVTEVGAVESGNCFNLSLRYWLKWRKRLRWGKAPGKLELGPRRQLDPGEELGVEKMPTKCRLAQSEGTKLMRDCSEGKREVQLD